MDWSPWNIERLILSEWMTLLWEKLHLLHERCIRLYPRAPLMQTKFVHFVTASMFVALSLVCRGNPPFDLSENYFELH